MEQDILKITGVLSDPTRFSIYQYISKQHKSVTVQEIADTFDIHPNVARLHLTKLEDVHMLISDTQKTGRGGRPSRLYRLSDEVISIQFPFRDYQLLASIALESLSKLGEKGQSALYETGRKFGKQAAEAYITKQQISLQSLDMQAKIELLREVALAQGIDPVVEWIEPIQEIRLEIHNCPFKEIAKLAHHQVCHMHQEIIVGMLHIIFQNFNLQEVDNMLKGEKSCSYAIRIRTN